MAFLVSLASAYAQQNRKVSGKVIDTESNEGIVGVTVFLKGTTRGTITDINGEYTIEIPGGPNQTLQFSFIGYETYETEIGANSLINVQLKEQHQQLADVVVVGYGLQKKESVVGSISSIDNKKLVSIPASNISQTLTGKLSGVQVVQSSGEVGNDVADVYVRGMATWNNATPLYVVDGIVRSEFAKIDPNEIQSINILKDASATAVYGVKGANGVIIITTKRGALGKPKINITVQDAVTQPINIPQPLSAYDAMCLQYLADWGQFNTRTAQVKGGTTADDLILWRTGASPWTHPDIDWIDKVMKKYSSQQQYNINVSGGTKTIRYFVSGGFLNQNGFYKNDDLTRYSRFNFRSNLDADISQNLSASLSIGARVEKLNSPNNTIWSSWDVYRAAFSYSGRAYPIYNPDGSYGGNGSVNIVRALNEAAIYKDVTSTLESSFGLTEKLDFITKGLTARAKISFDTQGEVGRSWTHETAEYVYDMATDTYTQYGENRPLTYSGVAKNYNWYKIYMEGGLSYDHSFGKHTVTGLLLGNRNELIKNNEVAYADQGLVGRVTYDYDRRYFGEVNVGYNGSENFPKESRYGFFPAFAAGWLISEEPFMKPLSKVVSKLKLRASLGWVGNDKYTDSDNNPVRFLYLQEYLSGGGATFGVGNNYYTGIQQGAIANKDVSWEVARKENIGFETDFFNGLFSLNFDYFYEYRNKILTDISAIKPEYVGADFKVANIGETQNQGFEVELKHEKKISDSFSYYVNGNFTFNRNKILKKADAEGLLPYQKEEGYAIGTPRMWKCLGYFSSYEEIQNSPTQIGTNGGLSGNVEVVPGDLKFEDFNNDGVIDEADAYRQGYGTVPEIQYGLTIGGTWKSFDFSMLVQGSTHALFMKQWEIMWAFSNNSNVFDKHNYYWAPEIADNAQFTRFYGKTWKNNERYYSTYEAGSGTYVRIKNLEVGYTLPQNLMRKISVSGARVYLSSNNLYMWSVEKYLDPDNRDVRGGKMPATRAFNLGLNISF